MVTQFGPQPIYRISQRAELLADALDMPFSPLKTLWESSQAGFLDSFGAGSIVKDFTIPRSTEAPGFGRGGLLDANGPDNTSMHPIEFMYEAVRSLGAQPSGKTLSEDEWKASPYYRESLPWDAGMTEGRAAALASVYDQRTARAFFGEKNPVLNFIGGVAGGFLDPVNFVPVFGAGARAAAVAKLGTIRGMAMLGASEAAISTAVAGYATQGFRATLGDDVSFEASINNIVFSAIAGTVFGGALGGLSRLAEGRRLLRSTETMRNLKEGRSTVLNDAVQGIVLNGDVELTPNSAGVLRRIADEVNATRDASRALVRETEGITATRAGEVAITPTGRRVEIRPEVVELADLQRATGSLQVRDRTRAASDAWIEKTATELDPARLMPAVAAEQGAPIVGPDNVVDSGNGRVSAIGRAYAAYPDKAAAYRAAIEEAGFSTEGMVNPVLISRRITPLSDDARAQFNSEANGPSTARMSATELAAMDRAALDDGVLGALGDGPVQAAGNRTFVARFLANLPTNEVGGLVDEGGRLNADGVRRIENALIAAAYGDVDASVIQRFAEATDDNTRSIVGAMSDVAGKWTVMRRAAKRGDIGPEFDQTPELTDALRMLSRWREQAVREKRPVSVVIKEGMGQLDILDGEIDAATKMFIRAFYKSDDFGSAASRETIAGRLNDLVDVTLDAGQPDMLGDAFAATKMGVLDRAFNLETDLFEAGRLGDGAGALGEAGTGLAARAAGEANPARAQEIGAGARPEPIDEGSAEFAALGFAAQAIERNYALATKLGVVDEIERLAGQRLTAKQSVAALGDALIDLDVAARANGEAWTAQGAKETLVRSVRNKLGIPSLMDVAEFDAWASARGSEPARLLGKESAATEAEPGLFSPALDMQKPRPEPRPDGLPAAAARVGKREDLDGMREQFGIEKDDTFSEQADIDALAKGGFLTEAETAILDGLDQEYKNADAWGQALMTAARCAFRY